MVSSKPWVTMASTLGPFSSMRALVPNVVAYRTESTSDRTRSRFRPARLQARSTEMRFMVVVSCLAQRLVGIIDGVGVPLDVVTGSVGDSRHRVGAALLPLGTQGVDVPEHVHGWRMARRYVLGLDLGGAAW